MNGGRPAGSSLAARGAAWAVGVRHAGRTLAQSYRLMLGVPDYRTYLDHMAATHPDRPPMDYETFFRDRQRARYEGRGRAGGCC